MPSNPLTLGARGPVTTARPAPTRCCLVREAPALPTSLLRFGKPCRAGSNRLQSPECRTLPATSTSGHAVVYAALPANNWVTRCAGNGATGVSGAKRGMPASPRRPEVGISANPPADRAPSRPVDEMGLPSLAAWQEFNAANCRMHGSFVLRFRRGTRKAFSSSGEVSSRVPLCCSMICFATSTGLIDARLTR